LFLDFLRLSTTSIDEKAPKNNKTDSIGVTV
jgi:hypothetical protein